MSEETMESDAKTRCHGGSPGNGNHGNSGNSGNNGNERRFAVIERDVAVLVSNYCTKEDLVRVELKLLDRFGRLDATLAETESRVVRWFFATSVSLAAVAFTAGKFL
ncbi:hypothetical protein [Pseudoduganella chitinolytica]|uniref:DUF1640 domain-containing protein n=1 Tax=Pseudoduganella chitinolytica TaxID=34070 RepID=A0ABY8BCS5_9BURK|nr:hypothetical protein [Pseudoduganella chitinolytica]WEF32542.1 hypothetical protein PX653_24525 [Pseudoduganella chitinolytica]